MLCACNVFKQKEHSRHRKDAVKSLRSNAALSPGRKANRVWREEYKGTVCHPLLHCPQQEHISHYNQQWRCGWGCKGFVSLSQEQRKGFRKKKYYSNEPETAAEKRINKVLTWGGFLCCHAVFQHCQCTNDKPAIIITKALFPIVFAKRSGQDMTDRLCNLGTKRQINTLYGQPCADTFQSEWSQNVSDAPLPCLSDEIW